MTWSTRLLPGHAPDGSPVVSVLAKRTWTIAHGQTARPDPGPPFPWVETDLRHGANRPGQDPVLMESELVAWKPATDVVVVGRAHAPRGRKARFFDAGVRVGAFRKTVRVFGNRRAQHRLLGIGFTDPEPFESMPLHYGLAYGGRHRQGDRECAFPPNPVGKGFAIRPSPEELAGLELPNLENPDQLLTERNAFLRSFEDWPKAPRPWALGPTGREFHPRSACAGLPPDAHAESALERSRLLAGSEGTTSAPQPMGSPQWHRGASEGLSLPHLRGDEAVRLDHLDPDRARFEFGLPGAPDGLFLDVGEGPEWMQPVLQDLVIHKEADRITTVWRGSCGYDGPSSMAGWTRLVTGAGS